ncbi:hypothetical protein MTO96_036514, partial [Rhipicephalus appendiculatus]
METTLQGAEGRQCVLQEQVSSQQVLLQSKFLSLEDHQNRQMDLSNVPRHTAASQSTEEKTYSKIEPGPELFPADDLQDYATATWTASSPQFENASDDAAPTGAAGGGVSVDVAVTGNDFAYLPDGT